MALLRRVNGDTGEPEDVEESDAMTIARDVDVSRQA
jgi:hypothetical protein